MEFFKMKESKEMDAFKTKDFVKNDIEVTDS
jgi:hypothetical protein